MCLIVCGVCVLYELLFVCCVVLLCCFVCFRCLLLFGAGCVYFGVAAIVACGLLGLFCCGVSVFRVLFIVMICCLLIDVCLVVIVLFEVFASA